MRLHIARWASLQAIMISRKITWSKTPNTTWYIYNLNEISRNTRNINYHIWHTYNSLLKLNYIKKELKMQKLVIKTKHATKEHNS